MKEGWKEILLAVVLAWFVPWVMVSVAVPTPEPTQPLVQMQEPTQEQKREMTVQVLHDGQRQTMVLDAYLTGVLLSEIPGSFHTQAKMAQAVVARTYTLRSVSGRGKHDGAICTDSACCQGYMDPMVFLAHGGTVDTVDAARMAVTETEDQVLTYRGELIDATYFSCSGGHTEDAVAVWGSDVPYLQGVESPGEEIAAHFTDQVCFTREEFCRGLARSLPGDPQSWFGPVTYTEGGGVATMVIGGRMYTGTELRALLGLRSTVFSVEVTGDTVTFTTRGFGHRVGMSQYGAQAMALAGSGYRDILTHYYTGTQLSVIDKGEILG